MRAVKAENMAATSSHTEEAEQQNEQSLVKSSSPHAPVMGPMVTLYPMSCIKKRTKGKQFERERTVADRFARYERQYYEEGIRRTIDAIVLVHDHGHPHVLMLHIDHKFWKLYVFSLQWVSTRSICYIQHILTILIYIFNPINDVIGRLAWTLERKQKSPGGKMRPGESELECLKRKLDRRLSPEPSSGFPTPEWKIVDLAGVFYRPNFEQAIYPYQVPHISETKEVKKLFVVTISGDCVFEYPANYGIEPVPLMELMDNSKRFGPVAASIPFLLARFQFICLDQQQ